MNTQTKLNPCSPKKLNANLIQLIRYLKLNEEHVHLLKYKRDENFDAEIDSCHINVWVKWTIDRGTPLFGWKLGQDTGKNFVEAIFHCVWKSPEEKIFDITPRANAEKRIMFVEDPNRQIILSQRGNSPIIKSFDNVRFMNTRIVTPLSRINIISESTMLSKYGLIKEKNF